MNYSVISILLLLACCAAALIWLVYRSNASSYSQYLVPGIVLLLATLGWQTQSRAFLADLGGERLFNRPVASPANGYVSSDECKACHPGKYATWHKTYHHTMTQLPSAETVAGDFSDQVLEFDAMRFRPFSECGKYYIAALDTRLPQSEQREVVRQVTLLTGSHNYQVYWYEAEPPRTLGQFPIVYFIRDARWIPRQAAFITPEMDIREHDETGRWNDTCLLCHSVNGRRETGKNLRVKEIDTRVAEFGIACEACHGPGGEHVRRFRNPLRRYLAHFRKNSDTGMVSPAKLTAERATHVCGQCHSIHKIHSDWLDGGTKFRPGKSLETDRQFIWGGVKSTDPAENKFLRTYYWNDGVVRVRGREVMDVLRSPCFSGGEYSCLSCHSLHKEPSDTRSDREWTDDLLRPAALDSTVCVNCHVRLSGTQARVQHTRHSAASTGSDCMNCHMPHTNIGFLRGIRNHRVTVPSVQVTLDTGRPLACNQCHLDKTLAWSADHLQAWYGQNVPELPDVYKDTAASLVWLWSGDPGQRALAAWSMRWPPAQAVSGTQWPVPHLLLTLADDYPGVRETALRSLEENQVLPKMAVDVFGEFELRNAQIELRRKAWLKRAAGGAAGTLSPALLILPDGRLDRERVDRLRAARDPDPLTLSE